MPENVVRILVSELSALDLQNYLYEHVHTLSTHPSLLQNLVSHSRSEIPINGHQVCFCVLFCFFCTPFIHVFCEEPLHSYIFSFIYWPGLSADGVLQWWDERGNSVAGGGGEEVRVEGLQPAEELQRPNNKHFGVAEERERRKKISLHHFLLFIFWSPDPHRTHWILIVESNKWTDLQFLTLMIPQ